MGLFENDKKAESECAVLRYNSFDGGGPEYTAKVDDETVVSFSCVRRYADKDHGKICGAGYDVVFTFRGLKEGETEVKISSFSPIVPPEEESYHVSVDSELNVKMTLIKRSE